MNLQQNIASGNRALEHQNHRCINWVSIQPLLYTKCDIPDKYSGEGRKEVHGDATGYPGPSS